jgi:hypothetical protein
MATQDEKVEYIVLGRAGVLLDGRARWRTNTAGDVVTVFQISPSNELVIEGKATIRKSVADVDEQYRVEFANKPGVTYERFVDNWGQDDPEKYIQDFNRRSAR